tara:strand:- start:2033 stop:2860 length:828 start_codon:yes stop_codon:yes gene_type:complete
MARQAEQDEQNRKLFDLKVRDAEQANNPWAWKQTGKNQYGLVNEFTGEVKGQDDPGVDDFTQTLSDDENRIESLISGNRKEFENSPMIKSYKAIKAKADTFNRSTQSLLDKFDKGEAANMAEQLDMIVSWYKMKDPTSTVTGGEVTSAADPGLADKANSLINQVRSGGSLTREQVASFRSSGLASASALYDEASSRATDYMSNVVQPNPYLQGRANEIVMPQYQNHPDWFIGGDQRFGGSPLSQNQPPPAIVKPPVITQQQQGLIDYFTPQPQQR